MVIERTGKERRYFGVVIYFTSLVGLEKKKKSRAGVGQSK